MSALKFWLETSHVSPVTQRGVHPLLLEALAALPLESCMAQAIGLINRAGAPPLCLGDLTMRQLVDLVIKPWTCVDGKGMSYIEAVHAGVVPLPAHPLDEASSTLDFWWTCNQVEGVYQGWHHDRVHANTASLLRQQPAILLGEDTATQGPCSRDNLISSGTPCISAPQLFSVARPSTPKASNTSSPASKGCISTQSLNGLSSPTGNSGPLNNQDTVFFVVHHMDTNLNAFVQLIKRHYMGEVWARQRPSDVRVQCPFTREGNRQQQQWCMQLQEPIYYFIDVLCLSFHAENAWESCLDQGCHRAIASSKALVLINWPSPAQPMYINRTWCLFCILLAAQLQKPIVLALPDAVGPLTMQSCLTLMEEFDQSLSKMAMSSTSAHSACDRDILLQLVHNWLPDLEALVHPSRSRSSVDRGRPGPVSTSTQVIEGILRARLKAAMAEKLFWGLLHSKYRSLHVVGAARLACESAAKFLATYTTNMSTALVAHPQDKPTGLGAVFNKAVSAVNTLLQASPPVPQTPRNISGNGVVSKNGTECGVVMEVDQHMTPTLVNFLREARRSHPAVAQVPLRCTCKCASCATAMTDVVLPVNEVPPQRLGPNQQARFANLKVSPPQDAHETIELDILVGVFPAWKPNSQLELLNRADQLVCHTAGPQAFARAPRSPLHRHTTNSGVSLIASPKGHINSTIKNSPVRTTGDIWLPDSSSFTGSGRASVNGNSGSLAGPGSRLGSSRLTSLAGDADDREGLMSSISSLAGRVAPFAEVTAAPRQGAAARGAPCFRRASADFAPSSPHGSVLHRNMFDFGHGYGVEVPSPRSVGNLVQRLAIDSPAKAASLKSAGPSSGSFLPDISNGISSPLRRNSVEFATLPPSTFVASNLSSSGMSPSPHPSAAPMSSRPPARPIPPCPHPNNPASVRLIPQGECGFVVSRGNRFGNVSGLQNKAPLRFEDLLGTQ